MKHFSVFDFFNWAEKRKNDFHVHNYEIYFFLFELGTFSNFIEIGNLNFLIFKKFCEGVLGEFP